MRKLRIIACLLGTAPGALLVAPAASAQVAKVPAEQGAADSSPAAVGEIVVTAQRTESLASKTPIALSAIGGEQLRRAGVTDARSLGDLAPNLAITENAEALRISIRGVTSMDGTEKGDPSAAFLLDGIYIARPQAQQGAFFDIERVEVLRGPQGTLYGRNTTAGVVNVITAVPKPEFAAALDAGYGNLDSANVTGMINLPVGADLGVRLAVNYDRQDNYIKEVDNPTNSINPFRDVISGRLSFGGQVGRLKFVLRGDFSKQKGSSFNTLPVSQFFLNAGTPTVDPSYIGGKSADAYRSLGFDVLYPARKDNEFWGVMGEFTYSLTDTIDLTYLGSYRDSTVDFSNASLLFGFLQNPTMFRGDYTQDSHEVRLAFGAGNRLHGQVGGYYFHERSAVAFNIGQPLSAFVLPGAIRYAFLQDPTVSRSKAAFGQITFDVTPQLHLTGGIRYTDDFKSRRGSSVVELPDVASVPAALASQCSGTVCTLSLNIAARSFSKTTWKMGIDYDAPGLGLLYASVATGYKAGGFNDGCVTGEGLGCGLSEAQLYYAPETLTAYEAGIKLRFLGNALRLNASVFHYDYKNLQLGQLTVVGGAPTTLTQNAGSAKVDGIETEALIQPSARDRVSLSINYTNARYDNFVAQLADGSSRDFHGLLLDHAPKWTATAGYTHEFPLRNDARIEAGVRSRLSSAYYLQDLNALAQFRQPSFTKTDATLTYRAARGTWYLQGFVNNIENEITLAAASSGLNATATIERPRTYGVRAGIQF